MMAEDETPEDVRKSLLDMARRTGAFAEETAALPVVKSEQHRETLAVCAEQLGGSQEEAEPPGLRWEGSVQDLIQIISDYEKLMLWLADLWPRLSPEDQAGFVALKLGPFIPGGAVNLRGALMAGFTIGVFADSPIQKAKEMRRVRDKRHPGSDEKKALLAAMYEQGSPRREIAQVVGIDEDALNKRLSAMFKAGELQKRGSRGRPKNK
jgi:predicted transcriptional regulator